MASALTALTLMAVDRHALWRWFHQPWEAHQKEARRGAWGWPDPLCREACYAHSACHLIISYYYTTYLKSWASSANCKQACDIWFCDVFPSILLLAGQSSLCQQLLQTKSAENKLDLNGSSANVQQQDREASLQVEESLQRDTRSEAKGMLPRPEFRSGEWYQIGVKSSWFLLTPWVEATHLFWRIVARTLRELRNAIWASRNVEIYTVTIHMWRFWSGMLAGYICFFPTVQTSSLNLLEFVRR